MPRSLPILMNGDMVRVVLDGTKTQTRRPVKAHDGFGDIANIIHADYHSIFGPDVWIASNGIVPPYTQTAIEPPCRKGDTLWVRETWAMVRDVLDLGYPTDRPYLVPDEMKSAADYIIWRADGEFEWCDETWNPFVGCSHVSPACDHCYAEAMARRWRDARP